MFNNFDVFVDTKDYKLKINQTLQSQDENPFLIYYFKVNIHDTQIHLHNHKFNCIAGLLQSMTLCQDLLDNAACLNMHPDADIKSS